jgi:hypothetical protein
LVLKKKVWACLSEDMDMFVYGCKRVLRYLSLLNHTVVLYNTKSILEELNLSMKEFREICVLSGTDYNTASMSDHCLQKTLKWHRKYCKLGTKPEDEFYDWLKENSDYVECEQTFKNIYNMFDLSNND